MTSPSHTYISCEKTASPSIGILLRTGISTGRNAELTDWGICSLDTQPPIRPETPVPNMVSTRPVTTWFPLSVTVIKAYISAPAAPAAPAASIASRGFPVVHATVKPSDAPISIIPSTPRFI